MAKRRMISESLGGSKKFARLPKVAGRLTEFCQIIYCLGIPHHDGYGQVTSDPWEWKTNIFRVSPRPEKDFQKALAFLVEVELFDISTCGKVFSYVNYENIQTFRKDRDRINAFPDVTWQPRSTKVNQGQPVTDEEKLREVKLSKEEVEEEGKGKTKENQPPSFYPLQKKFLEIVKTYPKEFKLRQKEDAQWLKDRVLDEPQFKSLDLGDEIDGWETWLEAEHRKKETNQVNRFPKSDFKQSLTNRFKTALKFKKDKSATKKSVDGTTLHQPEPEPEPIKSINPEAESIWSLVLEKLEKKLACFKSGQEDFDTWFAPTVGYDLEENTLVVVSSNQLFADWLKDHYAEMIKKALKGREVEFVVVPGKQ